MKIRNPALVRAAGWLGANAICWLIRSQRYEYRPTGPVVLPPPQEPEPRYLYLVWHENMLLPLTLYANRRLGLLVSKHSDGQLLGHVIRSLGSVVIHGSTNHGGVQAVRELIRDTANTRHLAMTPDGPRGPRRVVQPGAVFLASKTQRAIVPLGIGYRRPWRFNNSWDHFALPRPCARAVIVTGEPIIVPDRLRTAGLEEYRLQAQAEMERVSHQAEQAAQEPPPCRSR